MSSAYVHGGQAATLYTLQHGLLGISDQSFESIGH